MCGRTLLLSVLWLGVLSCPAKGADRADAPSARDDVEVIRSIPYLLRGEKQLLADLYRPRQCEQPLPVILMVHGGAWFSGNKVHVTLPARHAANAGYAVVAINYRLAPQHKFPAQVEDCQSALRWIGEHAGEYDFDLERVAAYGYSAGAHLVCLLATTSNIPGSRPASDHLPQIRAVVAGGSPCEFGWIPQSSNALAYWLGGSRAQLPEVYRAASPLQHIDVQDPPIFFFHGSADHVVPISSPRLMVEKLAALGVPSELFVVENAGHLEAFLREEPRQRAITFLNSRLGMPNNGTD